MCTIKPSWSRSGLSGYPQVVHVGINDHLYFSLWTFPHLKDSVDGSSVGRFCCSGNPEWPGKRLRTVSTLSDKGDNSTWGKTWKIFAPLLVTGTPGYQCFLEKRILSSCFSVLQREGTHNHTKHRSNWLLFAIHEYRSLLHKTEWDHPGNRGQRALYAENKEIRERKSYSDSGWLEFCIFRKKIRFPLPPGVCTHS